MNGATAAALTTARVCCDVPDATFVNAHAASNWISGLTSDSGTHTYHKLNNYHSAFLYFWLVNVLTTKT